MRKKKIYIKQFQSKSKKKMIKVQNVWNILLINFDFKIFNTKLFTYKLNWLQLQNLPVTMN